MQNLLHGMNLGANRDAMRNNNLVIVESLQWFEGENVNLDGTMSNFSELQFYRFLQEERISSKNKRYLCERFAAMEEGRVMELFGVILLNQIDFPQTYLLARLYRSDSVLGKIMYNLSKPYYYLRYQYLSLKDKFDAYNYLKTLSADKEEVRRTINWKEMYMEAQKNGEEACTNNALYIFDDYYDSFVKGVYPENANEAADVSLSVSPEWGDYEFFLDVCRELDLKPYVVIMSTNGLYYDHIGMNQQRRSEYYRRSEKLARQYGAATLNLENFEYEPYFYCDVMHLGWKGWLYVTENIINYYAE